MQECGGLWLTYPQSPLGPFLIGVLIKGLEGILKCKIVFKTSKILPWSISNAKIQTYWFIFSVVPQLIFFSTENDQNFIWSYMVRVKKFFNRNFLWNQFCNVSRAQNNQFQCYNSKKACLRDETNGVILSWTTGKTQPIGSKYRLFIYSIFIYYYLCN